MLISLLAEYHQQIDKDTNHPLHNNKHHILSFHEVIGGLVSYKLVNIMDIYHIHSIQNSTYVLIQTTILGWKVDG